NVCGLKSKLLLPEFQELIKTYDIFICVETKTDNLDILKVPSGYKYFLKSRKEFKRKSGGIAIFYKETLKNYIQFPTSISEFIQWVKISNVITQKPFVIGCVYIPPENSIYASNECFDEIENEMIQFLAEDTPITLIGDFNARTSDIPDFTQVDDNLFEILEIENEIDIQFNDHINLTLNNIPLDRFTQDIKHANNYGNKLLNMCRKTNMYITSGRFGADRYIGKVTCKDTSVVDYFIVNSKVFSIIEEFEVIGFDPLFSDVHSRLHILLQTEKTTERYQQPESQMIHKLTVKWKPEKVNVFKENVNLIDSEIIHLCNSLEASDESPETKINRTNEKICELLIEAASKSFGYAKKVDLTKIQKSFNHGFLIHAKKKETSSTNLGKDINKKKILKIDNV
ncbi:hypothetical protein FSP39_011987, partial [Pinctada imbricata]